MIKTTPLLPLFAALLLFSASIDARQRVKFTIPALVVA